MALKQTAGCPRVTRAKKFMCSPRNTGNIEFSLWLTGGFSQGCPDFQKVYVFKVYVPFSCPITACVAEACAVRPIFAPVAVELLEGVMKQMLVQGHTPRLMGEAREPGISNTRNQKNRTLSTC